MLLPHIDALVTLHPNDGEATYLPCFNITGLFFFFSFFSFIFFTSFYCIFFVSKSFFNPAIKHASSYGKSIFPFSAKAAPGQKKQYSNLSHVEHCLRSEILYCRILFNSSELVHISEIFSFLKFPNLIFSKLHGYIFP